MDSERYEILSLNAIKWIVDDLIIESFIDNWKLNKVSATSTVRICNCNANPLHLSSLSWKTLKTLQIMHIFYLNWLHIVGCRGLSIPANNAQDGHL